MTKVLPRACLLALVLAAGCGPKLFDAPDGDESESGSESGSEGFSGPGGNPGEGSCNPLTQDCANGQGCYVGDSDSLFECQTIECGLSDDRPCASEGEICIWPNDCLPGLICLSGAVTPGCENELGCCARFCDLEAPVCPPNTSCAVYFDHDMPPPAAASVGVCVAN